MRDTNLIEDLRLLAPPDWSWVWWVALGALVVAGTALAILQWRRRSIRRVAATPGQALAAWEAALRELERLVPLLRTDASREYALAATAVLRRYLEQRYGLHAPLLTTEEFLVAAQATDALPEAQRESLRRLLPLCDLIKFGRAIAETEELRTLHETAVRLVMDSRPSSPEGGQP